MPARVKFIKLVCITSIMFVALPVAIVEINARIEMLQVIIFSVIIAQYVFSLKWINKFIQYIPFTFTLLSNLITIFIFIIKPYYLLSEFSSIRNEQINKYHQDQIQNANFEPFVSTKWNQHFVYFDDIESDSSNWKNICFANYYHFKEVRLKQK